ncbi:hypothetical protein V8D89_011049 [Ganoderma adspersum]
MAFGILDDHKLGSVPGTGLLSAKAHQLTSDEASGLKRGTGKHSHIVLIPQPSNDPRDLLNWPRWKKEVCFWTLIFTSGLADTLWALSSPAMYSWQNNFTYQWTRSHLPLVPILPDSRPSHRLVQNAIAIKYGHRIVYTITTLLGFGEAAFKCLIAVTIEHLFLGTLINGYVIQNLSWQLGFWFISITCGLSLIGVVFFVPETTYHRQTSSNYELNQANYKDLNRKDSVKKTRQMLGISDVEIRDGNHEGAPPSNALTFLSQLKIYNGTFSVESVWKIFLRSFPFILSPVTWFVFVGYCMPIVLLTLIPLCASTIFTIEYGFNTAQVLISMPILNKGLTNLGALVGVVLALLITGPLNDRGIVWMSQHNRGIYEPEYRLILILIPSTLFCHPEASECCPLKSRLLLPALMLYFGNVTSRGTAVAYLIDPHGANATYIIALNDFARCMISYGVTFVANGIVLTRDVKVSLLILGACQAACWLLAVPMYVYGKRVRSFVVRHPRLFRGDLPASDSPQSATGSQTDSKR